MGKSQGDRHQNMRVRSAGDLAGRARATLWRDALYAVFPGLEADWLSQHVRARFTSHSLADAQVIDISSTPVRIAYTPQIGLPGAYLLVLQLAGTGRYRHAGREIVIRQAGDLVLLDGALPFDSIFLYALQVLIWSLPREALAPLLVAPDRATALPISGCRGLGAVLASYARALASQAIRLDQTTQKNLRLHLCTLVALTLGASLPVCEARSEGYRAARRQQILSYIEAHLRDADLSATRAAHELKMSRRWLYTLLKKDGLGFAERVARRRLEECRKLLDEPAHDNLSIADIAFRCGYNELSTFNRQFRTLYAVAPRDVRKARNNPLRPS